MKMIRLLILAPLVMNAGCVPFLSHPDPDADAFVKTQLPVDQLAACIGAAAGTTPRQTSTGAYEVDLSTTSPTRTVLVAQSKVENVVKPIGDQSPLPEAMSALVVKCAIKLTPPANAAAA